MLLLRMEKRIYSNGTLLLDKAEIAKLFLANFGFVQVLFAKFRKV